MLIFIDDLGAIFNVDSPLSCFTQEKVTHFQKN